MAVIEWIRFLFGALFLLCGLLIFFIEMIGVFRFKYVLNRMHAAAMGDTLGIASSLIGLMIISGFTFTSLKLFCVIAFLWFSSPTSSHLIARLEVATDEERKLHYAEMTLDELSGMRAEEMEQLKNERPKTDTDEGETQPGKADRAGL
ncbi:MAG: monovalent cation/H(+) antiporter subunit G [Lachnospiraceae bacterium]|nr:monovalent cation/H(+) antiporter subunit G [Lachnospiraceae bacterium]